MYAHLEHGGDFAAAASALRGQEFGGDSIPQPDVDLARLIPAVADSDAPPQPDDSIVDPGPIPEDLFHVPGFIGRVMDFTLANAPYPNVGLAFCGAIALQSYLCGRKVCTPGDLRPNLYVLALASSGTGKDFPRKVNARVLLEIGQLGGLGDMAAWWSLLKATLIHTPAVRFTGRPREASSAVGLWSKTIRLGRTKS